MALFTRDPDRGAKLVADAAFAAFAIGMIALSQDYPPKVRAFPLIAAWLLLGLVVLDFLSQTDTAAGRAIAAFVGKDLDSAKADVARPHPLPGLLWISAFAVMVYLIGFLATAAIHTFVSMTVFGRARLTTGAMVASGVALTAWVFFEALLDFRLFPGVLLEAWS